MKIKTEALTDAALDWAVAQCEGRKGEYWMNDSVWGNYSPPTNWALGGQIIEREKIQLTPLNQDNPKHGWAAAYLGRGQYGDEFYDLHRQRGLTPLVAAMRCYVTSKLGDEVEIPDTLLSNQAIKTS